MQTSHSTEAAHAYFWRDPALPFAESRRAIASRACYRLHTHDTHSIGVVDAGRSVFSAQGRSVRLEPGTLVAVPAGCTHACNPAPGVPWSYQMLHLDAAWTHGVLQDAGCAPWPSHALVVMGGGPAYQAFCALNQRLFSDKASPAEKQAAIAGFVAQGLWRAQPALRLEPLPASAASSAITRVLELLHARHADPLPLPLLAQAAGMAPRTLVRAFRAATGLTPHAYQLDLRINAARTLLRTGDTPADVAHGLGFYDQSHFHHAFKQHVAVTPGSYRG